MCKLALSGLTAWKTLFKSHIQPHDGLDSNASKDPAVQSSTQESLSPKRNQDVSGNSLTTKKFLGKDTHAQGTAEPTQSMRLKGRCCIPSHDENDLPVENTLHNFTRRTRNNQAVTETQECYNVDMGSNNMPQVCDKARSKECLQSIISTRNAK